VGDPKQAIYRFRGGDLATYLHARQQASGRFGLIENRRSTAELVEALNALMGPSGLRRSGLVVPAVRPQADRSGPASTPLELLWLGGERAAGEKPPSKSSLEGRLPGLIASHTAELLGRGLTLREKGTERLLQPDDICLLVGTHHQAEQLRAALQRQGIASRLVSQVDVFASPAATALQRFLDALADPADGNRLRLLAASPLLGWSAAEIATSEPSRWSALAGELDRLARRLPRQGLLGALAERLGSEALARISRGGRLLADLQQVSELVLAKIHADQLGPAAAADWLRRLRLDEGREERGVPEEHQAHSDRVDGVVSVVTVHASKGLEYQVVICPYLWQSASSQQGGRPRPGVRWQPPGSQEQVLALHLDRNWGPGREAHAQHLAAEQAERERLAYVGATRAQHLLVLAWGPAQGQQGNPLFPWLFPTEPLPTPEYDPIGERSDADWRSQLETEIERRRLPLRLVDPPAAESFYRSPEPPAAQHLAAGPVPGRRLDTSWGRSSYTSWTSAAHGGVAPAALDEGRDIADPSPPEPTPDPGEALGPAALPAESWTEQGPLAAFPRGATA
ncbi:MAG TPA: 3'-5' exonuclease, partial [Cyanobium sp.]|nr:3'-5' exonuclease [Cyanobium sp.]